MYNMSPDSQYIPDIKVLLEVIEEACMDEKEVTARSRSFN
jgi:hypothetical protein